MEFKIEKLSEKNNDEWDALTESSEQSTIFSLSHFLSNSNEIVDRFFILKGNEIKAGFYFPINNKNNIIDSNTIIYSGILFKINKNQKKVNKNREIFKITEFFVDYIYENYNQINLTLYNTLDIRPFLWKNYHSNESLKFKVNILYTSILNIEDFFLKIDDEKTNLYNNLDDQRKNDIKKANKQNCNFERIYDPDGFYKTFQNMMNDNKANITNDEMEKTFISIKKILKKDYCYMFRVKENEKTLYYTIFLYYKNIGYYYFGAGERKTMTRYASTFCIWESMKYISSLGAKKINFEGVNSPNRGDFKLSFGGNLKQYFNFNKQ